MSDNSLESQLLAENIGLVVAQAKKFKPNSITDIDDYKQAGYIALLKSIRNYNPETGTKLLTFAWKSVYREIAKEASKFSNKESALDFEPTIETDNFFDYIPDLNENESKILWMRLCSYTLQEIADSLSESKQSISAKLQKILKKIKDCNAKAEKDINSRRGELSV